MSDNSLENTEATENTEAVEAKAPEENVKVEEEKTDSGAEKAEKSEDQAEIDPIEAARAEERERIQKSTEKRFGRLTAQLKQQEEALRQAKIRMQELEAQNVQGSDAPNPDDFTTEEEYDKARIAYEAEKIFKQKEQERAEAEFARKQQQVLEQGRKRFDAMEQEFRESVPDYDENAAAFGEVLIQARSMDIDPAVDNVVRSVLMEVDNAPALINYFGQNQDEFFDLIDNSPVQVAFKLFELRQSLLNKPKSNVKELPQPVKPVRANATATKNLASGDVLKNLGLK